MKLENTVKITGSVDNCHVSEASSVSGDKCAQVGSIKIRLSEIPEFLALLTKVLAIVEAQAVRDSKASNAEET